MKTPAVSEDLADSPERIDVFAAPERLRYSVVCIRKGKARRTLQPVPFVTLIEARTYLNQLDRLAHVWDYESKAIVYRNYG